MGTTRVVYVYRCIYIYLYINLRRSNDCLCVSVAADGWPAGCVCLCHRAASFTYFEEVLRCPHKRIVTITKVYNRKKHYARGNNTIPYKLARSVTFESLKWKYSFATNSTLFMKLGSLLYVRCRHRSVKSTAVSNKTFLGKCYAVHINASSL